METQQRVVQRNRLFSSLIWALVAVSATLLVFAIVQKNLPGSAGHWPWKLQLLDIPTATTATLGTVGAAIARAQYARSVQPVLSSGGLVAEGLAPNGALVWKCTIGNAGAAAVVVVEASYWVELTPSAGAAAPAPRRRWLTHDEVVALLVSLGLSEHDDFSVTLVTPGAAYGAESTHQVAWFTESAMGVLADLFFRIRVSDRAGDVHERTLPLMKNPVRDLRRPSRT
ncbi:hypothetical protein GCM10009665_27130 [Kitasatospora nipponensis]|uniref:Uncharacterized protein n=1 Tax=Kitasatospora nipponensis TaxID=258049 RepID=A0ABN1W4N1_9ACTN